MKLSKTTNKNNDYLQRALNDLKASRDFIMDDSVLVMKETTGSASNVFDIKDKKYYSIEKGYGSDLCRLETAINKLERFIEQTRK